MDDTTRITPKMRVARELLTKALEAYFDQAYFASIHLAGGAEEILGHYVSCLTGTENAFKSLQNAAVRISKLLDEEGDASTPKAILERMTYARNRTKHIHSVDDDDIKFDPELEPKDILNRAVTNYYHLMNYLPLDESELLRMFNSLRDDDSRFVEQDAP